MNNKVRNVMSSWGGVVPVGTIISFMGNNAPDGYLKCDGTVYNITSYPFLANHFETEFGTKNYFGGDGAITFAVPDLRGEFLRGTGTNSHKNQGSGSNVGVHQDGTVHNRLATNASTKVVQVQSDTGKTWFNDINSDSQIYATGTHKWLATNFPDIGTEDSSIGVTSRPTNTSVLYCIAYQNIHISLDDNRPIQAAMDRWLRFDPDNKKGLIIKAGTSILKSNKHYKTFSRDTKVDFSSTITGSDNGKDFFVYLLDDDSVIASNSKLTVGVEIGRFHTLCASAGSTLTMTMPASPSSGIAVGSTIQVKPYRIEIDPDFYVFYSKTVTAVSAGTPYDVITCEHPLKGYEAGDILPESVFCKTFYPETLVDDAMVYDKTTDLCVDVYLQSGTWFNTRSAYNATHTVNRQQPNHLRDLQTVGKRLLSDPEFFSIALGSNECTAIQGAADKTTVGGHVDTSGRRMISAIGVEEACGYLWQWLIDLGPVGGTNWNGYDGKNSFGQTYGTIPYALLAGGDWVNSSYCGSGSRDGSSPRSHVVARLGGRGCIEITKSANAPKNSLVEAGEVYSTEERVVGTWIDGKKIYQKTIFVGSLSTGSANVNHGVSNLDCLIQTFGTAYRADGLKFAIPVLDCSNTTTWRIVIHGENSGKLLIDVGSGFTGNYALSNITITIRYTKTTDV